MMKDVIMMMTIKIMLIMRSSTLFYKTPSICSFINLYGGVALLFSIFLNFLKKKDYRWMTNLNKYKIPGKFADGEARGPVPVQT